MTSDFSNLGPIRHTAVSCEIVELAGKHTNVKVVYSHVNETDKTANILVQQDPYETQIGAFWVELDRLQREITDPLNEPVLPDDYPVYSGYFYCVNGKIAEFLDWQMTVSDWKRRLATVIPGPITITRCDIFGRIARNPLPPEEGNRHEVKPYRKNKHRKQRSSNKIKKVMG